MDWSLDQIENLYFSSRPSEMVLQRFLISTASIQFRLDAMDQELPQGISQESSQWSLKYEIDDILDEFWMSTMWDIWRFIIQ